MSEETEEANDVNNDINKSDNDGKEDLSLVMTEEQINNEETEAIVVDQSSSLEGEKHNDEHYGENISKCEEGEVIDLEGEKHNDEHYGEKISKSEEGEVIELRASANHASPATLYAIPEDMMASMCEAWDRNPNYYCTICEIECATHAAYKKHIIGAKHKKKEENPAAQFLKGGEDQTTAVEVNLKLLAKPVVGLEFIKEFYLEEELVYKCYLCELTTLNTYNIGAHLISNKHRRKFFQTKHRDIWSKITAGGKRKASVNCEYYARFIEETEGRKRIVRYDEEMTENIVSLDDTDSFFDDGPPPRIDDDGVRHCNICDIDCNSESSWRYHVNGAKHKKKTAEFVPAIRNFDFLTDSLEERFKSSKESLIGLEYVEEFHFTDPTHNEVRYKCHLCNISTLTCDSIENHIISNRHRRRYVKLLHSDLHNQILQAGRKNYQQKVVTKGIADLIEERFGRKRIVRMTERLPPHIVEAQMIIRNWNDDFISGVSDSTSMPHNLSFMEGYNSCSRSLDTTQLSESELSMRSNGNFDPLRRSPDHRRRSPADHRSWRDRSPDYNRRSPDGRRRRTSGDRNRRHGDERRRRSPILSREELRRMRDDRDRLRVELAMLKEARREEDRIASVAERTIMTPMGEMFERHVLKHSDPLLQNSPPSLRSMAYAPFAPPSTSSSAATANSSRVENFSPPQPHEQERFGSQTYEEGTETLVPPLQSIEAFCDPAIKDRDPWTEASSLLKRFAEVMFSIKISPWPPNSFSDIAKDSLRQAEFGWTFEMDSDNTQVYLMAEGVRLSCGMASISEVAKNQAFQIFVEKSRVSDYLILEEIGMSRHLRMFRSTVTAPPGAFRYDLQCKTRTVVCSRIPRCQFCRESGHIEQFCSAKTLSFR